MGGEAKVRMFCWVPVSNFGCLHLYLFIIVWKKQITNSKLSGHMRETIRVQCVSGANLQTQKSFSQIMKRNWDSLGIWVWWVRIWHLFLYWSIPFPNFCHFFVQKRPKLGQQVKKNLPSSHPWRVCPNNKLNMEAVCGSGKWKAKYIVKEHNSQTGQNLNPKMTLSRTKSFMIHVNKAE